MFPLIGLLVVIGSVAGGYAMGGGHFSILWQPGEFLIIGGAAFGAFLIANTPTVVFGTFKALPRIFLPARYNKKKFTEALAMFYVFFRMARSKGNMILEAHVDKPETSDVFKRFPTVTKDHEAMDFMTGYMRLLTFGSPEPHEIESVIDTEIEGIEHEKELIVAGLNRVGDATPGLGIVAAVLGIIHTMGAISEPPEILGNLIGAALVGTFFGVLLAYGFVGPLAAAISNTFSPELEYLRLIKAALLGHIQGYSPQVSVEFARKSLPPEVRPSFFEVDKMCQDLA